MNIPWFNSLNENIIIYDGEFLPDDIKDDVTRSIVNLFNKCVSLYDLKIYRSPHCIWFILSKNISEYYILQSLTNVWSKATNKNLLYDTLSKYPGMLQNRPLPSITNPYNLNYLYNLSNYLLETPDNTCDSFDILLNT